jgi:hypothetical protein
MDRTLLLLALIGTLALGIWLGLLTLGGLPRRGLRRLHWMAGLSGLVLLLAALRLGIAPRLGLVTALLVALALTLGAAAPIIARRWRRAGGEAALVLHVFAGIAGTLAAIAWSKGF